MMAVRRWTLFNQLLNHEGLLPERWLLPSDLSSLGLTDVDTRFVRGVKGVVQLSSMGSRNRVGKRLAMAEMSLLVARLLWEFGVELDSVSER